MSRSFPVDEDVAPVEALLSLVATQVDVPEDFAGPGLEATRALWLCPCYSELDAPTWVIHDGSPAGLAWCRVPDGVRIETVVDADRWAGGHTDVAGVRLWLEGEAEDPGIEDGVDDAAVVAHFTEALLTR